jgi:RHS repeat-associated protein
LIGTLSFTEHFTYKTPVAGRGNASFIIASISYKIDGNIQYTHHFTYDALGNITEISVTNASSTEIENYQYVYDGFNRLIRENIKTTDYEQTILYTYDDYSDDTIPYVDSNSNDNRGNITSIKRYAYTLDAEPSGTPLSETRLFYKTTGWKDQITRIEEHVGGTLQKTSTYVYDSIGNLLSITSDTNQSFTWEGRRLVGHTIGSVTYTYTYNDQGIRTSKSNGTNITEYFLDGSLVLFEKTGNDVIYYTYDVDGSLLSMNYNGNEYFYIKNLQGDIIEIVDASGYTVARYRYDAWGNIVYQEDSGLGIANINPYRYRSYRYDTETGLYYLNTRYYDPSIGRFISADSINFLDPSNTQGLNLYAYCGNNPVMMVDPSGNLAILGLTLTLTQVILIVAVVLIVYTYIMYYSETVNNSLGRVLEDTFNDIGKKLKEEAERLSGTLALAIEKAQEKMRENRNTHEHHIVAQTDPRASISRMALRMANIPIDHKDNIVTVNEAMHWYMHTTQYHAIVTVIVWAGYSLNGKQGVEASLRVMKTVIQTASKKGG